MITNWTFFLNPELFIPNLEGCEDRVPELNAIIDYEESEILKILLGACLNEEFKAVLEIKTDGKIGLVDGVDAKWERLLFGHTYQTDEVLGGCGCNSNGNCKTVVWSGLYYESDLPEYKGQSGTMPYSLLAYYIYSRFKDYETSLSTILGEIKVNGEFQSVTPEIKRVYAFNQFVEKVEANKNGYVGLYQFLSDHKEDFPEWNGTCLHYQDYYGIL